jgi:hypothetical protein
MKRFIMITLAMIVSLSAMPQTKGQQFCIAKDGKTASITVDDADWKGVVRAAGHLADDVRKVTGVTARIANSQKHIDNSIIVGTIGKSRIIDKLIKQKKLDVSKVRGQWESYLIDVVDGNLVIAGSDKRGTIYGVYEISQQMGVSPWYWWADVPVPHRDEVWYDGGRIVQPSPTVKYRGVFINDEDWGLKPWSSKNYERELGDIGPKTYARVCELLLRLKANMLAPAMHSCTGAFYSHPESKVVCDSFGIIVTTSHCEPLLLNNAAKSEWDQERDGDWNYKTNRETILKKWDDRLAEASQYENIYTTAMRGLHDAGLRGNLPMNERVQLIEQVFKDQRALLVKHNAYTPLPQQGENKEEAIPQIFVPYKETMDIYENGLRVPDDITLVWVDDNYGYMKRVSNPEEQKRSGRAGVYYHLSYLGAPHDYLWVNTTPPVLMYEELKKAYDHGADRYWLLNVGDIKPMELGIQTFMDMAWNINDFDFEKANVYQAKHLARLFPLTTDLSPLLDTYYRLAWARKPEYMGYEREWDDAAHTGLRATDFSYTNGDAQQRLADYQQISDEVERLAASLPDESKPAFFEMVQFPIQAATQMNRKFLMAQLNQELAAAGRQDEANWAAYQTVNAYDSINSLNRRYNEQLNGKWRGMMALPPGYCALYHKMPKLDITEGIAPKPIADLQSLVTTKDTALLLPVNGYTRKSGDSRLVRGIGYDWQVMQLGEPTGSPDRRDAAYVEYTFSPKTANGNSLTIELSVVPFWPIYEGRGNRIVVSVDDSEQQLFDNRFVEYSIPWKDQVLVNGTSTTMHFTIDPTRQQHTLRIQALDPGQMIQKITISE